MNIFVMCCRKLLLLIRFISSSISFKDQILVSYAARFPQNIDFSSILTHVHIKSIAHIGLSDILLIFHICYWQIGEGQQKYGRRNQTQAAIMEMMLNIPRGSTPSLTYFQQTFPFCAKSTMSLFSLLDASLHCPVQVCPG